MIQSENFLVIKLKSTCHKMASCLGLVDVHLNISSYPNIMICQFSKVLYLE